jgi:hypothetical protein
MGHEQPRWSSVGAAALPLVTDTTAGKRAITGLQRTANYAPDRRIEA